MRPIINKLLYVIPSTSIQTVEDYYTNDELYICKTSFINSEGLLKTVLKKRKKIECIFRTMRPVNVLKARFIIIIKPANTINIDKLCKNNNENNYQGPYWSITITGGSNKIVIGNNELIDILNILLYSKHLKLRAINLYSSETKYEKVFDCALDAYSFQNPYIIETAAIRIQYFWRKYYKFKKNIMKLFKSCLEELIYTPPGGYNGNLKFEGGIKYLELKNNFDLSIR